MNRTYIAIILGIIIIVVGIVLWQRSDKTGMPRPQLVNQQGTVGEESVPGKKMAFTQFLKQDKGSYECTVNYYMQDVASKSQVYVNEGNVSGKFTTTVNGNSIDSSFIMKDGFMYVWMGSAATGYKINVPDTSTTTQGSVNVAGNTFGWNTDQIGDYDCKPWTADASVFIPPANITFTQIGQ